MIICVDFDGVVADTGALRRKWLRDSIGLNDPFLSMNRTELLPAIGAEIYERMQEELGYSKTLTAVPIIGAIEALKELSQVVDVHLLSSRSDARLEWARRWLEQFYVLKYFTSTRSACSMPKSRILESLRSEYLVDNDPRHFDQLPKNAKGILFQQKENHLLSSRAFIAMYDWKSIVKYICGQVVDKRG